MSLGELLLVFVAGIGGGAINTIVGSGTLITFPTLVALGVPPVTANVSNAVGMFPGSLAGAWGYREELRGWRDRTLKLATGSALGAVGGALLLLLLPASAFHAIAPALIVVSLLLVLLGKRLNAWLEMRGYTPRETLTPALWTATFLIGVYGGYFGAAQGVLMMGMFGVLMSGSVQHHNAMKNLLSGVSKLVAAIIFITTAHIDWPVAGLIAAGSVLGGLIGAKVGRRLSPTALRGVIVVVSLVAVAKLLA